MNINVSAPINNMGYGVVGLNIVKAMMVDNINVNLWPIGQISREISEGDLEIVRKATSISEYDDGAPSLRIFHQFDLLHHVGRGVRVGWPIFELDSFNEKELLNLRNQNHIIVCSKWAKSVVRQYVGGVPISVVNLGVDSNLFKPTPLNKSNVTAFINVGKFEVRKGHDILPTIFDAAFNPSDNVILFMLCDNPFLTSEESRQWKSLYYNSKMGKSGRVVFISRQPDQQTLIEYMQQVDCGIFPTRAEGWGLPMLELLSMGRHLITTNYSGQTEFCNSENALLVDTPTHSPAYDGKWFFKQGNWGDIDVDGFVEHLRLIHRLKQNGQLNLNQAGIDTAARFSWKNSVEQLKSGILCNRN